MSPADSARPRAVATALVAATAVAVLSGCATVHPPIVEREIAATDAGAERTWALLGPERTLKIVRPFAELATSSLRADPNGQLYTEIRLR